MQIDVTLVAGRRPDLLAATLASFGQHLFAHFDVGTVYANIDPFCGTLEDGNICEGLIREAFPRVDISRPETPSFGGAVKRLWTKPQAPAFFHLEDDWTITEDLLPARITPELQGEVVQVQLSPQTQRKSPHRHNFPARWRKFLGLKIGKTYDLTRPLFTTSPSFVNTAFAARCAQLMDPDKDPEKQLYSGETDLSGYTRDFRSLTLLARGDGPLVVDLGRDWLANQNLRKEIHDGVSQWNPLT